MRYFHKTQSCSIYGHKIKKPADIHFLKTGIRSFLYLLIIIETVGDQQIK